jgi:hypothetical protein
VKIPRFIKDIATVIAIFALMSAAGWICSESGVTGNYPPVTMRFALMVQVIDDNGTLLTNQTVYSHTCLQKPAGWTSPTRYVENDSGYGITNDYGMAEIDSINYTLSKNDIMWLGVSTDPSLLESDFINKSFNPGDIGKWARSNYSDLRSVSIGEPGYTKLAFMIMVRNSDGRMIDINQFIHEHNFNYSPDWRTEAFRYMDNRSWDFSVK